MDYEIILIDSCDRPGMARPRVTRLDPIEDVRLRIESLRSGSLGVERIADEIAVIADLYQDGSIKKKDYSGFLDQLLNMRDGCVARDQNDKYGV